MSRTASRRPEASESLVDYHWQLIQGVPGECVLQASDQQLFWLCELAANISTEQLDRVHPPYGWTVRQVFEHCADAERVFGYRMLRLAAGDPTPLPGWDENEYAQRRFGLGNFGRLVAEIGALRAANLALLRRLVPMAWDRSGVVDGTPMTVRAIAWIAAGHLRHHLQIVERRCGVEGKIARGDDAMGDRQPAET